MILCVEWLKCTREPDFKKYVETVFRDKLLDFATPEQLYKSYLVYCACPHKPFLDYPRFYYYARRTALRHLSPKEAEAQFRVTFK